MTDPRGPIFLVGFMGAGKTTAGRALAGVLRWDFVDLDDRIVELEHRSIPRIFKEDGETYFRGVEAEILGSLRGRTRLVVACGGGTYANERSRTLIDSMGRAVWLNLPLADAMARCRDDDERPLLKDATQAQALHRARLSAYRAAPIQVDVEGLSPERVAERIVALL
jgi:shikimate kinase